MNLFARTLDSDSTAAIDYRWYLNGLPVQTSGSLSLGTDLGEGSYIVDLVALDPLEKRAGSSRLVVAVTGPMGAFGAIANPSAENTNVTGTKPAGWTSSAWGAASGAVFTYLNEGHSGSKSLKAEIASAISGEGDAKWSFDPVSLAPGEHYVFSHYYRSDVDTQVKVAIVHEDSPTSYITLPASPPSLEWKEYRATFTMPDTGKTATVYHNLTKKGWLVTDDYSIYPHDYTGFDRGMVSLSFDDGWKVNTTTALPLMQEFGFSSTQFYATTYIRNYSSPADAKILIDRFIAAGHEIGSHGESHRMLSTVPDPELPAEIQGSKDYLENLLNIDVKVMAAPYGDYNAPVLDSIMTTYKAQRSVDEGYNDSADLDLSRLKVQNIRATTTKAEIEAWLTKAREDCTWLILVYHDIDTRTGDYTLPPAMFRQHLEAIRDSELSVLTISEALSAAGLI
jgi:peptidoglycan/xylan/chitin deacetylase (PgdA/CDA1 family)